MAEDSIKKKRMQKVVFLYYSKPEVQKAIFEFCKNRETIPQYFEGFGKRPDILQYMGDLFELVKKGATSFHCSEEIWEDSLRISTDMTEEDINSLRIGWDLLIDIDCKYFDYAKLAAQAVIETLERFGVENVGLKFSVIGETPILVEKNKEYQLIPIENAIDLIKKGEKLNVLSLDKNRKLKLSKIYDYLEHKDTIYEITHSQSTLPLKTTKHHSVFIWKNGEIIQKKVSEIKKGEFLISFNAKENPLISKNLEVIHEFEFGKNQNSKEKIKRKIKITKELMRLIGYFLAEGHVTNIINQTGFSFHKDEKEYIEDVINILTKLTGRKISIRHPNPNSTQILIHSKEWATFFDNFCGKKKEKHVPNFVFKANKELFLELLKTYIYGDGHKKGEYGITIKSVSKKLITDLIWLCKLNNISCNMHWEKNKPHKLPQGTFFKGSLVYMLNIPKSELENLEFYRKRNKFSPHAGDRLFPVDGLKEIYKQIKPKMFNSHRPEQMTLKKKKANLNRIEKVIEWFENFKEIGFDEKSKKILNNYKKLFNSDVSVVEVKDLIEKGEKMVYDISVEGTESFLGNNYPVLLHNSGNKGFHILVPWKAFPKEINGIATERLFPDLPRKLIEFLRDYSEKVFKESLPEDFYSQFKNAKIKKGIKCKNCNELAEIYERIELYCNFCKVGETKKISKEVLREKYFCPECRRELAQKRLTEIYECKKCDIDSVKQPRNFSSTEEIDLYELMGLDFILISPRHLFRSPYSLHEKTSLSSVVLTKQELVGFEPKQANPLNVIIKNFSPEAKEGEAKELIVEALDWFKNKEISQGTNEEKVTGKYADFKPIKIKQLNDDEFPPCIKNILKGLEDGKKRSLFILINIFRSIGMDKLEMEKKIYDWNDKNKPPLKKGYIQGQLKWSYDRKPKLPPNCKKFYQEVGICSPDNFCPKVKNPLNYVIRKNLGKQNKKNTSKKS